MNRDCRRSLRCITPPVRSGAIALDAPQAPASPEQRRRCLRDQLPVPVNRRGEPPAPVIARTLAMTVTAHHVYAADGQAHLLLGAAVHVQAAPPDFLFQLRHLCALRDRRICPNASNSTTDAHDGPLRRVPPDAVTGTAHTVHHTPSQDLHSAAVQRLPSTPKGPQAATRRRPPAKRWRWRSKRRCLRRAQHH